ncbi:MAG: hypothetical protein NDJ72_02535 [Elusimicrobia bacterium]|nr:hypothetical protein [Elusimicrobiota bacterium]
MNNNPLWILMPTAIAFALMIALFFITRMFWLWYFKLDKIEAHLAMISMTLKSTPSGAVVAKSAEIPLVIGACPYCPREVAVNAPKCNHRSASGGCPRCGGVVEERSDASGTCSNCKAELGPA